MHLTPGTRIGPFEIVAPLGAGGMGEVYRARDPRLGRDVAIKALPPEFSQDRERLARFEREARLLASLSHPNIAGLHGLEDVDGARYLVLELVEGETLAERISRGPLPPDEAIEIAREIAAGVEAAHENGVVHRDLKPGNVMLTPAGTVKVLDFGLAKSGTAEGSDSDLSLSASPTMSYAATQAGVILGTAVYMSPEQARGRRVDKRTDVWSFGCVLYESLTGRQAFEGETVSDLIAQILTSEPDWSLLPPGTPAHVIRLLERCLRKDPRERLRDIGEARIALGASGTEEVPRAAATGKRGLPRRVVAAMTFVVAATAVIVALRFGFETSPGPVRKFDLIAEDMVVDWPIAPVLSPDGSRIAYSTASQIWVRDLDRLEPRAVAGVSDAGPITWSPDSDELLYGDDRKLWKVTVEGGRPTAVCEIPATGNIIGAAWSASGTIAFSVWRDNLYQVPATGGSPTLLVGIDPATQIDFHAPTWLPGGELMYVTHWKDEVDSTGKERSGLTVFDGQQQTFIAGEFGGDSDAPLLAPTGELLYLVEGATPGIWAVPFDLGRRRATGTAMLVGPDAVTLSLSEDGSLLYVEGSNMGAPRDLVSLDRTGKLIEKLGSPHKGFYRPSLSPDGRKVAFSAADNGNADVWVLDLATGSETRLTFGPLDEYDPEWLGSSSRLAYVEESGMEGRVLSINADGTGEQRVLAPSAGMGWASANVRVAPDGTSGVRIVDHRGRGSLKVGPILSDGTLGPVKPFFAQVPEPNVGDARISPDGRTLAYQTKDPGQIDIFLTRYPGGQGRWQVGTRGGFQPRWARQSGELLFVAGSGPTNREMVAVEVDPSQDPPLGPIMPLFDLRGDDDLGDFDVSPDGQRFYLTRPTGAGATADRHLVLVQNWRSEFGNGGPR